MIQKLGKYTIVEKLGEGAMGAVYKAYHDVLDRYVAIKTMAEDIKWDPELKLRFYREARLAASLRHPNIVIIHDLGEEGKITYIVMELLEGTDLKGVIKNRESIPLEKKLSIMIQVADGMNHAHLHGIIHRDIKPGNIHINPDGSVKILDFGIARIPSSDLTRSGVRLGTPVYMSPEQIKGVDYDERSDIFSAGIVFYELLTYQHPFRDKNLVKTMDNILFQTNLPIQDHLPNAPQGLLPIIAKCLEKEPDRRYANMADVGRACRQLMEQLVATTARLSEEVRASWPRLLEACEQQGASPALAQLFQEVKTLMSQRETPDYLSLQAVVSALSRESILPLNAGAPSQQSASRETKVPEFAERPGPPRRSTRDQIPVPDGIASIAQGSGTHTSTSTSPGPLPAPSEDQMRGNELARKGEALLKEKRYEEALECLRQALGLLGPTSDLVQKLSEARRIIDEKKKIHISECLDAARSAMENKRHADAIDSLDAVLNLEPDHPEAVEMRRHALADYEADKATQARRDEGEKEKAAGFRFLGEGKWRDSIRAFRHATELLGEDPAISLGIAEADEALRTDELRARAKSELAEAWQSLREQAFDKARQRAQRALELSPKNPEALEILSKVDQAQEEKRRRNRIAELQARCQEALDRRSFDDAMIAATEGMQLDPEDARFRNMLDQIEKIKEETRRKEEFALLLSRAEEALKAQHFDEAIEKAESALSIIPGDSQASECIRRIQTAKEDDRKRKEVAELTAQAQQCFLHREMDKCETLVQQIQQVDPQNKKALDLIRLLEQARHQARKEKVDAILNEGQRALSTGDFQSAEKCAREALNLEPDFPDAKSLLDSVETAREEARRRELREKQAGLLAQGKAALDGGDLKSAESFANEIFKLDEKNLDAMDLLYNVEEARKKVLTRKISEILDLGRLALRTGDPQRAAQYAHDAQDLDAKSPETAGFLGEIEQARQKALKEKVAALLAKGRILISAGDLQGADGVGREILALDTQNADGRNLLAEIEQIRKKAIADKISGFLSQGRKALGAEDFRGAERYAREVMNLDAQNQEAQRFLGEIKDAEEKAKKAEIASLLESSREAIARSSFEEAAGLASKVLGLDPKNKDVKGLFKEIEKARKEREKQLKKEQKNREQQKAKPRPETDIEDTAPMKRPAIPGKGKGLALKIGIPAAVLVIIIGILGGITYSRRHRPVGSINYAEQLAAAQSHLEQKRFDKAIELAQQILAAQPENAQARALLESAQRENKKIQIEMLLMEAQNFRAQNNLDESKRVLKKILEMEPSYEPAITVLGQIESAISATKSTEEQDAEVQQWLATASSLIESGKLVEAKAELDKVAKLRPAHPQLALNRKRLDAKTLELSRKQRELSDTEQKQAKINDLTKTAEDQFRQAQYSESQSTIDQVLSLGSQNSHLMTLRNQAIEAQRQLKLYDAAFAGRQYDDAIASLDRLQKLNSSDPGIAERRKRVESRRASAKAQISVYRLGEAATVLLDDKPAGADGELENATLSIGKHTLAIKNSRGQQNSKTQEFTDGQNLTLVYDAEKMEIRPMAPADRDTMDQRKLRERVVSYQVEHSHTFGKCNGELRISGFKVEYISNKKDHSFDIPFRDMKLASREDKLEFSDKRGNKWSFKTADPKKVNEILQLWSKLEKTGR